MKFKGWHGVLVGAIGATILTHLYHTKTAGPGTVRGGR